MTRWSAGSPRRTVDTSSSSARNRCAPAGVGRAHGGEDLRPPPRVGDLLDDAADLRVALPVRGVARARVQREARVALEVAGLDRAGHRAEPQVALDEAALDAADAGRAILAQRCD